MGRISNTQFHDHLTHVILGIHHVSHHIGRITRGPCCWCHVRLDGPSTRPWHRRHHLRRRSSRTGSLSYGMEYGMFPSPCAFIYHTLTTNLNIARSAAGSSSVSAWVLHRASHLCIYKSCHLHACAGAWSC